jgi:hypothetical protein
MALLLAHGVEGAPIGLRRLPRIEPKSRDTSFFMWLRSSRGNNAISYARKIPPIHSGRLILPTFDQ